MDFQENLSDESRDATEKALSFPSKVLISIHRSQPNAHTLKRVRGEYKTNFQETPPNGSREELHCSPIKVPLIGD